MTKWEIEEEKLTLKWRLGGSMCWQSMLHSFGYDSGVIEMRDVNETGNSQWGSCWCAVRSQIGSCSDRNNVHLTRIETIQKNKEKNCEFRVNQICLIFGVCRFENWFAFLWFTFCGRLEGDSIGFRNDFNLNDNTSGFGVCCSRIVQWSSFPCKLFGCWQHRCIMLNKRIVSGRGRTGRRQTKSQRIALQNEFQWRTDPGIWSI